MNVVAPVSQAVPSSESQMTFESLFNEGNLLKLLVAIRGSSMPNEEKMVLRDLVLEYSQLDTPDKKSIVEKQVIEGISMYQSDFAFLGIKSSDSDKKVTKTPAIESVPLKAPPVKTIGRGRPRPVFTPVSVAQEIVSDTAPEVETAPKKPVKVPEEKKVTKQSAQTTSETTSNPLARIQEIKQSVNSKIGNPVNLIDANNAIGREYMNALLDAMKKVSGGEQSGELQVALSRLETAYKNVEGLLNDPNFKVPVKVVSAQPAASEASANIPTAAPVSSAAKVAVRSDKTEVNKQPDKIQPSEAASVPAPEVASVSPTQSEDKKNETPAEPLQAVGSVYTKAKEPLGDEAAPKPKEAPVSPLRKLTTRFMSDTRTSTPQTRVAPKIATEAKTAPKSTSAPLKSTTKEVASEAGVKVTPKAKPLESVASVETLPEKMSTLKKVMDKKAADDKSQFGEDLMDERVTEGLKDLLANWRLFKRSGMLGTGPNGIDHPLYAKLSRLPMAAVISGRFEGATPDIKQSITDYMNGWRYEQNVTHEMNELFEHYLRRVILHILKKHQEDNSGA